MIMNKKLDRFKQWAGERMGGEVKTSTSEDFKDLEKEMGLRYEGMDRLQKSMTVYVKSMSKRNDGNEKEKTLPVFNLGHTMVGHSEDFDPDSEFGNCLAGLGRANERISRLQEGYTTDATSSWLEGVERSLAQMKEYQAARKKLETRRLAYDTSLAKMQRAKKEDFRVEEELRSQKAKYEESSEDVFRRMEDVKDAEADSVADLTAFLESELTYYDRCRDVLMQLKKDWPAATNPTRDNRDHRRSYRPHSNSGTSCSDRYEDDLEPEPRAAIRRHPSTRNPGTDSPLRQTPASDYLNSRPSSNRSSTFEGLTRTHRDETPPPTKPHLHKLAAEPIGIQTARSQLRPVRRSAAGSQDSYVDGGYDSSQDRSSSPEGSFGERSYSPATSYGSIPSRNTSWSIGEGGTYATGAKKVPPPPPPSRSKKPPPPPPMKRSALSTSAVPYV